MAMDRNQAKDMRGIDPRDRILTRMASLQAEQSTWKAHWQEIGERICPRPGLYFPHDRNRGHRRHGNIIDNTGIRALRILSAGMMAGATSPARQWFKLQAADPDLNDFQPVREWLALVEKEIMRIFSESNTYRALPRIYTELGAFGTAATLVKPHRTRVIHHYPVTIGEFAVAQDYESNITTIYREFERTVVEIVKEFGFENCTHSTQSAYQFGNLDSWVPIVHAIEPREDRDMTKIDALNKKFRSVYMEIGAEPGKFLRESGFDRFPALVPRWEVWGNDVYGHSPGMEALGDVNALQHAWLRTGQVIDYKTKPPVDIPSGMKNRDLDLKPGGRSYSPRTGGAQDGIRNAFQVDLDLGAMQWLIEDIKRRVRDPFHADMFLMLYNSRQDPGEKTATEVAELHDEKLLMLGPALEQQQNDLHGPLVELTYEQALMHGRLPAAPPDIHGLPLEIKFISTLAQAQQLAGLGNVDRYIGNILAIGGQVPDVIDNVDFDAWSKDYTQRLGVPPAMQRAVDEIADLRQARAESQRAAAQAEMLKTAGAGAASLAKASEAGGGGVFSQPEGVL